MAARLDYSPRITEEYILQQLDYHVRSDRWTDIKRRTEDSDRLYNGDLKDVFPEDTALPRTLYIENKFKNSLHDATRLAAEGRGMPRAMVRGNTDRATQSARIQNAIYGTYWEVCGGRQLERSWYMDLLGGGMMLAACYYTDGEDYPLYVRLNPRYCYPTVRNGELYDLLHVETVRERVAAEMYDNIGLDDSPQNPDDVFIVCYYSDEEVVEAIAKKGTSDSTATITQRWTHNLDVVPVAFEKLTTYDDSIHGMLDGLAGPMAVRNKMTRFIVDEMEQIAHAPVVERNIDNWDEEPGPVTTYHGDKDADSVEMRRLEPASPGGGFWGMLQYMDQQETREGIQPTSRLGTIPQSQATGSFVWSTQGTLTSLVIEMQNKLASFRVKLDERLARIDERYLDFEKPLVRSVGRRRTYQPKADIDGWYHHTIDFGATAGLDKANGDTRLLNMLSARVIDRGTVRANLEFLDDDLSIQEKIDRENVADAILQRFATDPRTPLSSLVNVFMAMDGKDLVTAMEQVVPELQAAEQAAQTSQTAGAAAPGAPVPPQPGALGLPEAQVQTGLLRNLPTPSRQQVFVAQR